MGQKRSLKEFSSYYLPTMRCTTSTRRRLGSGGTGTLSPKPIERSGRAISQLRSLRHLLNSAIELHMRSDVPVGTCLSGGVDSSTIVCWMSRLRNDPVRTFSGLYDDDDCDESKFVEEVRRHTGCHGADIRREPDGDFIDDLAAITWHQDMPTAGPGLYTQYHVMARASEDVTVILDGQGGDELFAGYLPYYSLRIDDLFATKKWKDRVSALSLIASVAAHWGPKTLTSTTLFRRAIDYSLPIRRLVGRFGGAAQVDEPPFFHTGLTERVSGMQIVRQQAEKYSDKLSQALYRHLIDQSIPALLHYEDRNSMAFSVEARVPLLDYRIVEFALGLAPEYKIRNSWTKWVLRKAAEDKLPRSVAWRRSKLGYPTPAARWMRKPKERDAIRDLLFCTRFYDRGVVSRESLEYYWNQHQNGIVDRSWLLYRYVTLELWYRQFIELL